MNATVKRFYQSTLFQSSGVYTAANIVAVLIPFFLMPVLTRYLTPVDYGIISMFQVLVVMVSPFIGLSIQGAIAVEYFKKNKEDLSRYIGNCFFLLLISTVFVSLILWIFSNQLASLTSFPKGWLWSVVFYCMGQFVILVMMTLWQNQSKPFSYGIYQILQIVLNIGLTILFLVYFKKNWQSRVEAQLVSVFLLSFLGLIILYRNGWLKFSYNSKYIIHALKFGVPLIPHTLGAILITQTNRIFITKMVGVYETGIFTVGYQIASIIALLSVSFNSAYAPWLYQKLKEGEFRQKLKIVKFTYFYFIMILFFAAGLSLTAPWLLTFLVGKSFIAANKYIIWISIGAAFTGMYYMVAGYVVYAEKTHILAWVTFSVAIINIFLNYLLIKNYGAIGAAQASAVSLFLMFILTWLLSFKCYKMPWNLKVIG